MFRTLFFAFTSIVGLTSFVELTPFVEATIRNCGEDASLFEITRLSLTPENPVAGDTVELLLTFNNPGIEVEGGTATTSVTMNFIPFAPSVEHLCVATECPIIPGINDRSAVSIWPDSVHGKIKTVVTWENDQKEELLCIEMNVNSAVKNPKYLRGSVNTTMIWYPICDADTFSKDLVVYTPVTMDSTAFVEDYYYLSKALLEAS
jgi:hypothetical protein